MTVGFAQMLDRLAEAEKGGLFGRLMPLSEIDTIRLGHNRSMVHPQWIFGKGTQRDAGSDPAT